MPRPNDGFFWDGYLHWAQALETVSPDWASPDGNSVPQDDIVLYEPLFIRTHFTIPQSKRESFELSASGFIRDFGSTEDKSLIEKFLADFFNEFGDDFRFLGSYIYDDVDFLIGLLHTIISKAPLEFFIYRKVPKTQAEHDAATRNFTIIDIGAPALAEETEVQIADWSEKFGLRKPDTIGAVIDNDIGYLNHRFRYVSDRGPSTRFAALWLQSRERIPKKLLPSRLTATGAQFNIIGRLLSSEEVTGMIQDTRYGEESSYQDVNENLHLARRNQVRPPRDTHGTSVADLAYGEEPDGDVVMTNMPILGIQLPPVAAEDTSGTHSESYIV